MTAVAGTARRISRPDAIMGGKTGTAQVVRIGDRRLKKNEMAYHHRDHAWLVSFGIKDEKSYVVVVMVEHGGGGSSTAGPVVAKVYESLFGPVQPGSQVAQGPSPFSNSPERESQRRKTVQ
jgi:penicillin-binding protein 2